MVWSWLAAPELCVCEPDISLMLIPLFETNLNIYLYNLFFFLGGGNFQKKKKIFGPRKIVIDSLYENVCLSLIPA